MILDGVYQAQTGEDGRFSFADLPGGTYWLSAYNQDYLYPPLQTLKLKEGETADPVVIELVEAVTVHGRLLDVDGKPMAGREIEFSGFIQAGATFQGWEIPRVTTEADGQFTLRANRLGLARLQVLLAGEGYAKAQFEIREGKNIEGLELRLRRFCRIVGTVRDRQANRPLPGILIRARTDQFRIYFLGWSGQAEATSDEAGRFEIGGLLPATYSIQVAARGYRLVSDPQVRLTEAEEVKEITVELERSTPVQRWVCRSDGQAPLVGAWVAVRSE
jgi:hypothetical protein